MIVSGSHGAIVVDWNTGDVQAYNCTDMYIHIVKFDVNAYRKEHGDTEPNQIDILDIGYWNRDGGYEERVKDWRI